MIYSTKILQVSFTLHITHCLCSSINVRKVKFVSVIITLISASCLKYDYLQNTIKITNIFLFVACIFLIHFVSGSLYFPQGYASGSFGPTTAGRMDSYVDTFQANGGSMIMLAKGNRSKQVRYCHILIILFRLFLIILDILFFICLYLFDGSIKMVIYILCSVAASWYLKQDNS